MARLEPIGRTLIAGGSVPLPDYWGGMNDLAQVAPLPPLSVHVLGLGHVLVHVLEHPSSSLYMYLDHMGFTTVCCFSRAGKGGGTS